MTVKKAHRKESEEQRKAFRFVCHYNAFSEWRRQKKAMRTEWILVCGLQLVHCIYANNNYGRVPFFSGRSRKETTRHQVSFENVSFCSRLMLFVLLSSVSRPHNLSAARRHVMCVCVRAKAHLYSLMTKWHRFEARRLRAGSKTAKGKSMRMPWVNIFTKKKIPSLFVVGIRFTWKYIINNYNEIHHLRAGTLSYNNAEEWDCMSDHENCQRHRRIL